MEEQAITQLLHTAGINQQKLPLAYLIGKPYTFQPTNGLPIGGSIEGIEILSETSFLVEVSNSRFKERALFGFTCTVTDGKPSWEAAFTEKPLALTLAVTGELKIKG